MSLEEVQLAWKLSLVGSEEVKSKIASLHEQFNRGEVTVDEYADSISRAERQLSILEKQAIRSKTAIESVQPKPFQNTSVEPGQGTRAFSNETLSAGKAPILVPNRTAIEEAKQQLAFLDEQYQKGEISALQYAKAQNQVGSQLGQVTRQGTLQGRMWLSQHPTISMLSRTMSGFNRVLMAATQAMTLMNTASLLMRTNDSSLIDLNNQLAEATRNYNAAITTEDREKWAREQARIADELTRTKEQMSQDTIQGISSFAIGVGSIAVSSITAAIGLKSAGVGFGIFAAGAKIAAGGLRMIWAALGPVGLALIALSIIIPLIIDNWDAITAAFSGFAEYLSNTFAPVLDFITTHWKTLLIVFTGGLGALALLFIENWDTITQGLSDAWNTITSGLSSFWEGFQSITTGAVDAIVSTVTGMVDRIIGAVKNALDWLAKLPGDIAKGIGNTLFGSSSKSSSGATVKKGSAGLHAVTSGPEVFMAGEGGTREEVIIRPLGQSTGGGSSGGNVYVTIHNEGSVIAERDLEGMINRYGIRQARRHGWQRK